MSIRRLIDTRDGAIYNCTTQTSVREAIAMLAEHRIGAMPVMSGDSVAGVFSERDAVYRLHESGARMLDLSVAEVMTTPVVTVTPEADVLAALSLMTRRRIRHLPVIEDGRMVGFVSIGDLVKYRIDRIEAEAETLRAYIQAA